MLLGRSQEEGDWALTSLMLFKFSLYTACYHSQLTEETGLLVLAGKDPWLLLGSEEVYRGRGSILLAFRRSLIS